MTVPEDRFPVTEAYRGMRLDRFLQRMLPRMSRAAIQEAIATRVRLSSGAPVKPARRADVGDTVILRQRPAGPAPDVVLPVLAAGDGWSVIDKPPGIASTPSSRHPGRDVVTMLGASPAHRLDRGTSGCLLLAHDAWSARAFDLAFRHGRIDKRYLAIVAGSPARDAFVVDAPLGTDAASRVPGKVAVVHDGLPASTQFEVLARGPGRALVAARPRTGRRHQIRVHLAHAGHPIVGDLLYGGDERQFVRLQLGQPVDVPPGVAPGRHLLHAERLTFPEPGTGRCIEVAAPRPADFAAALPG